MHRLLTRVTDTTCFWMSCVQLCADSQRVMTMRLMGMGGTWSVPQSEARDMVTEKIPAFTESFLSGAISAMSGDQPEQIGRAALEPLTETARSNRERLEQYGPRLAGLDLARAANRPQRSET